jgi:hypothetical protein
MAEISISSSAPIVNVGNDKSSKENNSTLATHAGKNQPFVTAEISISSSAPNVNIGNGKSSNGNNSILPTQVVRNQPSATAIPTSISSRYAKSMAPNVNIGNNKSSKDSSSMSKSKGEHRLAMTKDQVNKILDASKFPFISAAQ